MLAIFLVYVFTVLLFRPFFRDGTKKMWSLILAIFPFILLEYMLIQEAGSNVGAMIFYVLFAPVAIIIGEFVADKF
jgi:hypothetical protein